MEIQTETPLAEAIAIAGGITKFSRALGLNSHMVAYQWVKTRVPAERCPDIESLTGIKCEQLRPDVNWSVVRGTARKSLSTKRPIAVRAIAGPATAQPLALMPQDGQQVAQIDPGV